ncbi:MAG: hypothetical protein AB7P21_23150 [Lautropia sp.]
MSSVPAGGAFSYIMQPSTMPADAPHPTDPRARRTATRVLLAKLLGLTALLAGCGPGHYYYSDGFYLYDGYSCPRNVQPAIIVEFVARGDGRRVAVGASGVLADRGYTEQMVAWDRQAAIDGRTDSLAGAFGRPGVYDVRVRTQFDEVHEWDRVVVYGDNCGPLTVVLTAPIVRFDTFSQAPAQQAK